MTARMLAAGLALLSAVACASKRPVVTPLAPAFAAFETPAVPPDLAARAPAIARRHDEAWAMLQAGDVKGARVRYSEIVAEAPLFYPAQAGLGFAELALKAEQRATEWFVRALEQNASYVPALLGQAEALARLGRDLEAVVVLESASAAEPARADLRQRLESARLSAVEGASSRARRLADEGRLPEARQSYELALAVSPDSVFLRRELALVDLRLGDLEAAGAQVSEAVRLDPTDVLNYTAQAEVLEAMGRWKDAADALRSASRLGAGDLRSRIARLEERAALDSLPEEYRSIPSAQRVTRAELAALVAVRIPRLVQRATQQSGPLITDVGTHWARRWVLEVAGAGLMEVFPNHTFQPSQVVTRGELAGVISRALAAVAVRAPGTARDWTGSRQSFADIGPGHLAYPAASVAVASGVLAPDHAGAFVPARPVTGREAAEAVGRLERLVSRVFTGAGA